MRRARGVLQTLTIRARPTIPARGDQGGNKVQKAVFAQGAGPMVLGALIFLVYAGVFFFRAFASSGFEVGVETLNGVTPQQLDGLNPAIILQSCRRPAVISKRFQMGTAAYLAASGVRRGSLPKKTLLRPERARSDHSAGIVRRTG